MKFGIWIGLTLTMALFGAASPAPLLNQKEAFHSQSAQDRFVYTLLYGLLGKQDKGYYLEIGAGEPIQINNSYFFEKNLKWDGVSIDIAQDLGERWYANRKNRLLTEDATQSNYSSILQSFPKVIDYLSLDVDGYYDVVLEKLPLDEHLFKVITIEHDFYRFGDVYRRREREILQARGYHLLCSNVMNSGYVYEDWWIHPAAFPAHVFSALTSLDLEQKEYTTLIERIQILLK